MVYDYVDDSRFHAEAYDELERLDGWLIPSVVLEEFVFAMKNAKLNDAPLKRKVDELLSDRRTLFTPVEARDVRSAVTLLSSEKASFLRFNDKLVLSVARRRKSPLLTFDKQLQAESRRAGVRLLRLVSR